MNLYDIYFKSRRGSNTNLYKKFYSYEGKKGKIRGGTDKYLDPSEANFLNNQTPNDIYINIYQRYRWMRDIGSSFKEFEEGNKAILNLQKFSNLKDQLSSIDINSFSKEMLDLEDYASTLYYGNEVLVEGFSSEEGRYFLEYLSNAVKDLLNQIDKETLPKQINYIFESFENRLKSIDNFLAGAPNNDAELGMKKNGRWDLYMKTKVLFGYILEREGRTFFQNSIPSNLKVVNTGQIKGPSFNILNEISSTGVDIKEDMLVFSEEVMDSVKISYTIGAANNKNKPITVSLRKFLKELDNKKREENIHLSAPDYKTLIENSIAGISSKLASGNNIKFANVSLKEVLEKAGNTPPEEALKAIIRLKQQLKASIYANAPNKEYNPYFNFSLANSLNYIVGKNNKIILTSKGFDTMYNYVLEKLDDGNIFHTNNSVSIGENSLSRRYPISLQIK